MFRAGAARMARRMKQMLVSSLFAIIFDYRFGGHYLIPLSHIRMKKSKKIAKNTEMDTSTNAHS